MRDGEEPGIEAPEEDRVLASYERKSKPGAFNHVCIDKHGGMFCTCGAFKFQKLPVAQRKCEHIDRFRSGDCGP